LYGTKQSVICYLILVVSFMLHSCKSQQTNTAKTTDTSQPANTTKFVGIVSHQYKSSGCGTIVLYKREIEKDTLFLIPMTSLGEFDKDGLEISFNYRMLRVHNPKGCKGIPVQLSDIKVK
jgi:hypothetical protein